MVPGYEIDPQPTIVCVSHRSWECPEQPRYRELFSRLGDRGYRIFYFECRADFLPGSSYEVPDNVVRVVLNCTAAPRGSRLSRWRAAQIIAGTLKKHLVSRPFLWFNHPSLFGVGYSQLDTGIIYDSGEILYTGADSDDDLYFEELMLLAEADLVLANGPTIEHHLHKMSEVLRSDLATRKRPDSKVPLAAPVLMASPENLDVKAWDMAADVVAGFLSRINQQVQAGRS